MVGGSCTSPGTYAGRVFSSAGPGSSPQGTVLPAGGAVVYGIAGQAGNGWLELQGYRTAVVCDCLFCAEEVGGEGPFGCHTFE